MSRFKSLIGKMVNISYQDATEPVSRKGRVIFVDDEFLELRTRYNRFLIKISSITSVKEFGGGENNG